MALCGHVTAATAREIVALLSDASFADLPALCERYAEDPRVQVRKAVASALRRHERDVSERDRVLGMYEVMRSMGGDGIVIGVDEVGRGAIAGPLTVGAVALRSDDPIWGINDSKQLTPARREALAAEINERAIAVGLANVEPGAIDKIGMSAALRRAMSLAIENSGITPDAVLIDGRPVHAHPLERAIVKGDAKVACIAAASIVAKVSRDSLMVSLDAEYPGYHLAACKGYGSPEHIAAIKEHGLTSIHRASFCSNFLDAPTLFLGSPGKHGFSTTSHAHRNRRARSPSFAVISLFDSCEPRFP